MLPERLLRLHERDGEAVPAYLGEADAWWIERLLEEIDRFAGRPLRELRAHLRGFDLPEAPPPARAGVEMLLLRGLGARVESPIAPRDLRDRVFLAAATLPLARRASAIDVVAREARVGRDEARQMLYADLPGERVVAPPDESPAPADVVRRYNLVLAQGFLFRSEGARVTVRENARSVVAHAKLRRLICSVTARPDPIGVEMELSGPLSLFHRTLVYGRALGGFLASIAAARDWCIEAPCVVSGRRLRLRVASRDPLWRGAAPPRRFDSAVERVFWRDFRRLDSPWEIHRESEPVAAGSRLFFPDFTLVDRLRPSRRVHVEIVGFWTPEYLDRKRRALAAAGLDRVILCVDAGLGCGAADFPGADVILYRRRVDAVAVLAKLEGGCLRAGP